MFNLARDGLRKLNSSDNISKIKSDICNEDVHSSKYSMSLNVSSFLCESISFNYPQCELI